MSIKIISSPPNRVLKMAKMTKFAFLHNFGHIYWANEERCKYPICAIVYSYHSLKWCKRPGKITPSEFFLYELKCDHVLKISKTKIFQQFQTILPNGVVSYLVNIHLPFKSSNKALNVFLTAFVVISSKQVTRFRKRIENFFEKNIIYAIMEGKLEGNSLTHAIKNAITKMKLRMLPIISEGWLRKKICRRWHQLR